MDASTGRCPTCSHESCVTKANVKGDTTFCVSCGEEIAESSRTIQERVDVLRCQPFANLSTILAGGAS